MGSEWPTESDWRALELARDKPPTASQIEAVARQTTPDSARWAFGQWELRARARPKFVRADEMLFTKAGLEMASHPQLADYHAGLFPEGSRVADLTCGIGADLIAFARRGQVVGFDADPIHAACARHNLAVHGLEGEVIVADCRTEEWPSEYVFLDPGRRTESRRIRAISEYLPDPVALLPRLRAAQGFAIKLSPMLPDDDLRGFGVGVEFISAQRECREALINSETEGVWAVTVGGEVRRIPRSESPWSASEPGHYIFEADPAAIRAHALGGFGLDALGDSPGYLTGDDPTPSPWLTAFRVVWFGPWHERKVKQALRERDRAVDVVKMRGVPLDPDRVRASLRGTGQVPITALLYPVGPKVFCTLVEKLP